MCSIGEDDFGDDGGVHAMIPDSNEAKPVDNNVELGECKKCSATNVAVYKVHFRDYECKDCFLANARHKFRATLGSSKVLPRDAKVLLAFDGSAESLVLLDMLFHAQTQNTFKRLHCTACILYIDEILLGKQDKAEKHIAELQGFLDKYAPLESYIVSFSMTNDMKTYTLPEAVAYCARDKTAEVDFIARIQAIRSLTSRQEFIRYHRKRLIAKAAKQLECPFVFVPDISTTLATQLLSAIALGRGASAAYDVALFDERLTKDVKLIRPLRDLNVPEIELYLRIQDLKPFKTKAEEFGVAQGPGASLQNLTNAFVENLQKNYSNTVSTVFRSAEKIAPYKSLDEDMSKLILGVDKSGLAQQKQPSICSFCCSPLETTSNSLLAIEFSRLVSEKGATSTESRDFDAIARENLDHLNDDTALCHGCRNIEKDCDLKLFENKM